MAADLTFPVREEVVAFLRASGPVTALLPAERIYGSEIPVNPVYPYVRFGQPDAVPLEYSCQNGATVTSDLHVFSRSEAECYAIAAELVASLDDKTIGLGGGMEAKARWTGGPIIRDPEDEELWHGVRTFEFEAAQ